MCHLMVNIIYLDFAELFYHSIPFLSSKLQMLSYFVDTISLIIYNFK